MKTTMLKPCKAGYLTSKSGITLIELVIVMGLIFTMLPISITLNNGMQRRSLSRASLQIQSDVRRVQRLAVAEGRRWRIEFDRANNSYTIFSVPREQSTLVQTVYLPRGVWFGDDTNAVTIEYLPRGTTGSPRTIQLRSGNYTQNLTTSLSAGRIEFGEIIRG